MKSIKLFSVYFFVSILLLPFSVLAEVSSPIVPLKKAAEEFGDAGAQFLVGHMYDFGQGVEMNKQEAVKWYKMAAKQKYTKAQYYLGLMYISGNGVEKNINKAIESLEQATDNNENALFELGNIYFSNEHSMRDYAMAHHYFKKAAKMRHAGARLKLARMYRNGWGVKVNYKKWHRYLTRAAEAGNKEAQYELAVAYHKGSGVNRNFKLAVLWYINAAEQEHHRAEYALGLLYAKGVEIEANYRKAKRYLGLARVGGITSAQEHLRILENLK